MKENTQEKNLIEKSEKSILGKIKNFFKNLFSKNKRDTNNEVADEPIVNVEENNNEFKETIKITADEETKLLELQRMYHNGAIAENDLTDEQIDALCDLYDKQIAEIKKTIKMKEEEIQEYKKSRKQRMEKKNA